MAVAYNSSKIVTNGLVLCLDAANRQSYPGSGTTWTDLSGTGSNGTLQNGSTYTSNNAGAIVLDGVNDYISVTSNPGGFVNNISFEFWYKSLADFQMLVQGSYGTFMICRNVTGLGSQLAWKLTKPNVVDIIIGTVPRDSNWHQVVGTFSSTVGEGTRVYVDGALNGSSTNTNNFQNPASSFTLGTVPDGFGGGSYYLTGNIANVKLYNRPISAAEVLQNFNATRGRFGV